MRSSKVLIITGMLLMLIGCLPEIPDDSGLPSWSVKMEVPMVQTEVVLDDLLEDSLITKIPYNAEGDSIFVFNKEVEIEQVTVGDQLSIDDIEESFIQSVDQDNIEVPSESFSQSVDPVDVTGSQQNYKSGFEEVGVDPISESINSVIGVIELNDITPTATDPYRLNEIVPEVNSIPDGSAVIPGGALTPIAKPFDFDDFESADFSGGVLDITINNDMIIPLGAPFTVQLQEINGSDTTDIAGANVVWNDPIPVNTSSTRQMDLSGLTLPGSIIVLITGNSDGSNGETVNINNTARNSSFNVEIGANSLEVTSATAKIPSQTIDELGSIEMAESENKVQTARILNGNLEINIDNNMAVESDLNITIHSLQDEAGVEFSRSINLSANSTSENLYPISDMFMVMAVDDQKVEYSYQVVTVDTDPGFATISESDSVVVEINLFGNTAPEQILFSEITGIIESQEIIETGDIDFSSDSKILTADISAGTIDISINNLVNQPGFGGIPVLELTIPEIRTPSGDPLTLDPEAVLNPGNTPVQVDLTGHSLVMPDTTVQVMTYTTTVTTPVGELGKYSLLDSIEVTIDVGTIQFVSVEGYFNQEDMTEAGIIQIDEATKINSALISSGELILTITNDVGVVADVDFVINELMINSTSLERQLALTPETSPLVENIDLSGYTMDLLLPETFEDSNGNGLYDTGETFTDENNNGIWDQHQQINYESLIALPVDQQMALTFGNNIDIQVDIQNLNFTEITGYISQEDIVEEGQIEMDDSTKVDLAVINNGILEMSILNNIGVVADVDFTINEIVDGSGAPFAKSFTLDPDTKGSVLTNQYSLENYSIDLDLESQTINYQSAITMPDDVPMSLVIDNDIEITVRLLDMTFKEVSGVINPVQVDIDSVEQEITSLPEEMDGLNFVNVDMYLDFLTDIDLPVFLNLDITAYNESGDSEMASVVNWNINDSAKVILPDPEKLINIKPNRIVAAGTAVVGQEGVAGTVNMDDVVGGTLYVKAPLELEITGDANIDTDPEIIEDEIPEELEGMTIVMEVENQFDFGTMVTVLAAGDTNFFDTGESDTLFQLELEANISDVDSLVLDDYRLGLFTGDTLYIKSDVNLTGMTNGEPSRFLSTDSLKLLIYGRADYLVDPNEKDDDDEEE